MTADSDFVQATQADFDELIKFLNSNNFRYGYNYDSNTATTKDVIESCLSSALGIDGFLYFFGDDTKEYYENAEIYEGKETDPLGKFDSYGNYYYYYKLPVSDIKWVCEDIFNITFKPDYVSDDSYIYDDYCYRSYIEAGDGGIFYCELGEHSVSTDGKYEIIIKNYSKGFEETDIPILDHTKKLTAEIKIIDGERYWSIYKIEDYDPSSSEPEEDTTEPAAKDMYDENVRIYTDFLKNGGAGDFDNPDIEMTSCLIDMNDDGVYELVLRQTYTGYVGALGHGSESYIYGIQNGFVVQLKSVEFGGGTAGGDTLEIKYDNINKKPVVYIDSLARDGLWAGTHAVILLGYDGKSVTEKDTYERSYYSMESETYKQYVERVKRETSYYFIEDATLYYCMHNDEYITRDEFKNNTEKRFTDLTDAKYQMKKGTKSNPLGL